MYRSSTPPAAFFSADFLAAVFGTAICQLPISYAKSTAATRWAQAGCSGSVEEQVVLEKLIIAQPAAGFVKSLRRLIHHAGAENESFGARFYRVLPGPLEKCSTDAAAANVGAHEEIVQDPHALE